MNVRNNRDDKGVQQFFRGSSFLVPKIRDLCGPESRTEKENEQDTVTWSINWLNPK